MARVIHFEVHAEDPERAARFYEAAFGWRLRRIPGIDYWTIATGDGPGVDGGLQRRRGPAPAHGQPVNAFVCTLGVDDLDASMRAAEAAGAKVALARMAIAGVGYVAHLIDTEGNIFGLLQHDPGRGLMRILPAFAALALLAACGRPEAEPYPPAYELNFMQACQANNPGAGVCACLWRRIVAEVPRRDFEALERLAPAQRDADPRMTRIREWGRSCAAEGNQPGP